MKSEQQNFGTYSEKKNNLTIPKIKIELKINSESVPNHERVWLTFASVEFLV